jgi:hypothetical protein
MAFADRLIDRMLDKSDPTKALESRAVNSMILQNDADAVATVNQVMLDVAKSNSPNPVIVAALERIASKIAL